MARRRRAVQYTFEGGEADAQYERRTDSQLWIRTARRLRNVRILNGGPARRRPGTAREAVVSGPVRFRYVVMRNGDKRLLVFRPTAVDVYKPDRSIEQTVTGAPWASGDLSTIQVAYENDNVIITSRSFAPQALARSTAGSWSLAALSYDAGPEGSLRQPYFRFSDTRGISLTPSATTGAITLTASAAVFVAGHVGTRFRILGREVNVTGFTSSTQVNATVVQTLYPTMEWTVGSTSGFGVGDQVSTTADSVDAEVVAIVSATVLRVIVKDRFTNPTTTSNTVVGPATSSALSAVAAAGVQGATTQWDEQMISSVRGYPNGCLFHRARLYFNDFPAAPEYLAASSLGLYRDFDTGTGLDDDAIIDGIGDAPGRRLRHLISAEQLIALADSGAYYVGDGALSVITPTTIDFLRIGPEAITACNPVIAAEGVIYFEQSAQRVMLLQPQGTVRRSWTTTELADLSPHLISTPSRFCMVDGSNWGPERYAIALNADGSLAVMHFRRGADTVGWGKWTTDGTFIDIAMFDTEVWVCVLRAGVYTLESFSTDRLTDESVVVTSSAGVAPTNAAWANKQISLVWRQTAGGQSRRIEVGLFQGDGAGALTTAPTAAREYEGGRRFPVQIGLWPPSDPELGPGDWMRVSRVSVDVHDAGLYYVDGRPRVPYRASDDITQPPPLRTGWRALRLLGRLRDKSLDVTQVESAPLTVRAVTMDVA